MARTRPRQALRRLCRLLTAGALAAACSGPPAAQSAAPPTALPAAPLAALPVAAPAALPAAPPAAAVAVSWEVPFGVRGRLADPHRITWRVDPEGSPLDDAFVQDSLRTAAAGWNGVAGVGFAPAAPGAPADVTVRWRRAADDECRLFGRGYGVAHTGPLGPGSFIHLDAGRAWEGDAGADLTTALAHELGHVLGLDHSPDPSALMFPDTRASRPAAADVAGLWSLYGGGEDAPGDVVIEGADGAGHVASVLRSIAPPALTELALFDTDGDGAQELLVWRTDPAGLGALTIYRFERSPHGPRLNLTRGPWLDIVPSGALTSWRTAEDGSRWIVVLEAGQRRVRTFDDDGRLREPDVEVLIHLDLDTLLARPATAVLARPARDTEGGGAPGASPTDASPAASLTGDLDGDGQLERLRRHASAP